ncbi:MAG: HAMP domain-containing sensor histidine kinase [Bacteroidota bacterium]
MSISALINFFINPIHYNDADQFRHARLFVKASFLTSLFSNSYVWLSVIFEFEKGVYLMVFNVLGFLILPFLSKTKLPIVWIGNLYVFVGAFAVIILTYYSGGLWSAIYPWIISIPILALLVVNRLSASVWGGISFGVMVAFGLMEYYGYQFPLEYNTDQKTLWFITIVPGLLLIILFISFVFEYTQTKALKEVQIKNALLEEQKSTISEQSEELKTLIEDKDYIIRILAHDLRNPLANIQGLTFLIENENDADQKNTYLSMIKQAVSNAQNLVQRVLEMDESDQDDVRVNIEELDINKYVSESVEHMREAAQKKSIEINLDQEPDPVIIHADKTYLLQIFENLLSNAIKFSPKETVIKVLISIKEENVHVRIMDEGPGIHPEEQGKLFQKFSKLSTRPTGGESSTGLGLSLVKRYVELIDGKVWYEDEASKGSTFVVEFPLSDK